MDTTSTTTQHDLLSPTQGRWQAVTELFGQCVELDNPEAREELLATAPEPVADEVRSLLANVGPDTNSSRTPAEQLLGRGLDFPSEIGPYRIERLLGEGGMGSVFLAHRIGEFDQQVAIKLIRRDFGVVARTLDQRFRQERQILASLQHPNIAHLIDGGTSEGFPYLVVEYVPGVRVDEYCRLHRLSVRQRIALFLNICKAVQYAHQNLVVHRDLKPANVLVLEDGAPKLLDFGIAKLLREDDSGPDLTRTSMKIFTPSYASPEQLRGEQVGTSSDVYSLGVMLYELLAGQKPYLVETGSELAMLEAMLQQTPAPASVAIKRYSQEERQSRAAERTTTFPAWSKTLRSDLDLVLSRAIDADRSRRYQSVEQFANDLERYLADLPISARRDAWTYRTYKFWNRHKALVSLATVAVLLLVVSGLALWRESRISNQQRLRAERRFNDLRGLARSNVTEVQDALDHVQGGTAVRTLILGRTLTYLDGLAAEKDNDIDLQRDLATAYLSLAQRLGNPASANLGDIPGATANYDRGIRLREAIVGLPKSNESDRYLLIHAHYAKAFMQMSGGHLLAAKETLSKAGGEADALLASHPADIPQALHAVSLTHGKLSDLLLSNDAGAGLADPVEAQRQMDIALPAAEEAYRARPGDWRLVENLILAKGSQADILFETGRVEEALKLQKSVLDFANAEQGVLPAEDADMLLFQSYEYGLQLSKRDPKRALPWLDTALATVTSARAADPVDMKIAAWQAIALVNVGHVHCLTGDRQKGRKLILEGIALLSSLVAKQADGDGQLRYALAAGYRGLGDVSYQRADLRDALQQYEIADRVYGEESARVPDDLEVNQRRAENQLAIAATEDRLGNEPQASANRALAGQYIDRVLYVHPDNPVAKTFRGQVKGLLKTQ